MLTKFVIGNGSVEIVDIDPRVRSVTMMITLPCTNAELHSEKGHVTVLHKANFAFWYLVQEGFITEHNSGWLFHLGGVAAKGNG